MRVLPVITRAVMRRLLGRRRSLWLMVMSAAPAPILFLVAQGRSADRGAEMYNDITVVLGVVILYPVVALIISTAALGEEWKNHTLPFLLVKPVSRWVIALGVVIGTALSAFLVLEAGVLLTWLAAGIVSGDWSVGVATTVAVAIQSVASAAIFVPFGLILGRATLVGLGYLLIWEGILSNVIEGIQASSISRIVLSGWADLAPMTIDTLSTVNEVLGRVEVGLGGAVAKVAVMALVSVALTGLVLRHKDLVGD